MLSNSRIVVSSPIGGSCSDGATDGNSVAPAIEAILRAQPLNPLDKPAIRERSDPQPTPTLAAVRENGHPQEPDGKIPSPLPFVGFSEDDTIEDIIRKDPNGCGRIFTRTGYSIDPSNAAHLAVQHSATYFNQGDTPVPDTDA